MAISKKKDFLHKRRNITLPVEINPLLIKPTTYGGVPSPIKTADPIHVPSTPEIKPVNLDKNLGGWMPPDKEIPIKPALEVIKENEAIKEVFPVGGTSFPSPNLPLQTLNPLNSGVKTESKTGVSNVLVWLGGIAGLCIVLKAFKII